MPREIAWKRPELYPLQSACVFGSERFSITEGGTKSGKTVAAMCWLIEQAVERGPGYYPLGCFRLQPKQDSLDAHKGRIAPLRGSQDP